MGDIQMKTLLIIQARLGSRRLPRKILLPLAGKPLLERMIERVQHAKSKFELVVATTNGPEDIPVRELCRTLDVPCHSGHPTDLLDRHFRAARKRKADVVVKIPSDCPLIDPAIIDAVLDFFNAHRDEYDYVSNLHPATYPDGNDVEVMSFAALEEAWRDGKEDFEREHTTPFLWERPGRFRIGNVTWGTGRNCSMSHRWTVDYAEDYLFVKAVFEALWRPERPVFSLYDILGLLNQRPEIVGLNSHLAGVNWYRHHKDKLRTVSAHEFREAG